MLQREEQPAPGDRSSPAQPCVSVCVHVGVRARARIMMGGPFEKPSSDLQLPPHLENLCLKQTAVQGAQVRGSDKVSAVP